MLLMKARLRVKTLFPNAMLENLGEMTINLGAHPAWLSKRKFQNFTIAPSPSPPYPFPTWLSQSTT